MCSRCIKAGKWSDSLEPGECEICGPDRYVTFSSFALPDASISDRHYEEENPIGTFINWLIFGALDKSFTSHCYAHNSGRYGNLFLTNISINIKIFR